MPDAGLMPLGALPETLNPKPETRNSKHERRNPEPEILNSKNEADTLDTKQALTCLTLAYCLSALYLDGVKLGDTQMLMSGPTIWNFGSGGGLEFRV